MFLTAFEFFTFNNLKPWHWTRGLTMVRELIRIEGVDRSFGPVDVLKDISFNVNDGDRIGIVGHNGAGKTTLLNTISEQKQDVGDIELAPGIRLAYLTQIRDLESTKTIEEELSRLRDWKSTMAVGPMIAQMRGQAEAMRRAEIEKIAEGLSAEEIERLDRVTRAVMNKLLHGPTMAMKEYARQTEEGIDGLTKMSKLYLSDDE